MSPTQSKKSRKGLVAGGISLVLILIVTGILLVSIGITNNNTTTVGSNSTKDSFNQYSNYLLYQVESKEDLNEDIVTWPADKINENLALTNEQDKMEYFNTLITLFNTFSDNYYSDTNFQKTLNTDEIELVSGLIGNNKNALEALNTYAAVPNLSMEDMTSLYFANGSSEMIDYVSKIYADAMLSENAVVSNYGEAKINLANEIVELHKVYNSLGCINGGVLVDSCVENNIEDVNVVDKQASLADSVSNLDSIEWHMVNDVTGLSQMLYECFYGTEDDDE